MSRKRTILRCFHVEILEMFERCLASGGRCATSGIDAHCEANKNVAVLASCVCTVFACVVYGYGVIVFAVNAAGVSAQ